MFESILRNNTYGWLLCLLMSVAVLVFSIVSSKVVWSATAVVYQYFPTSCLNYYDLNYYSLFLYDQGIYGSDDDQLNDKNFSRPYAWTSVILESGVCVQQYRAGTNQDNKVCSFWNDEVFSDDSPSSWSKKCDALDLSDCNFEYDAGYLMYGVYRGVQACIGCSALAIIMCFIGYYIQDNKSVSHYVQITYAFFMLSATLCMLGAISVGAQSNSITSWNWWACYLCNYDGNTHNSADGVSQSTCTSKGWSNLDGGWALGLLAFFTALGATIFPLFIVMESWKVFFHPALKPDKDIEAQTKPMIPKGPGSSATVGGQASSADSK